MLLLLLLTSTSSVTVCSSTKQRCGSQRQQTTPAATTTGTGREQSGRCGRNLECCWEGGFENTDHFLRTPRRRAASHHTSRRTTRRKSRPYNSRETAPTWEVLLGQQGKTSVNNMLSRVSLTVYAMNVVETYIVECRPPLGAPPPSPTKCARDSLSVDAGGLIYIYIYIYI